MASDVTKSDGKTDGKSDGKSSPAPAANGTSPSPSTTAASTGSTAATSTPTKAPDLATDLASQVEWKKILIYHQDGKVVTSTFKAGEVSAEEIKTLLTAYKDRDHTVGAGVVVGGLHYEVHRFHEDLIYGRRGEPGEGAGFCLCRRMQQRTKRLVYFLITYLPPTLSARAIPQLLDFCRRHLENIV